MKYRPKRNESGFSLVEVMIAICVLGVGLLAIASMQVGAVNANAEARGVSEASALADFQMETLMSLPYRFNLANDNQNPPDLQNNNPNFQTLPGPDDILGTADDIEDRESGLLYPFPDNSPIFDTANLAGLIAAPATAPDHQRTINTEKRIYTIFWNVETDYEINDTKTIHMTVSWTENDVGRKITMRRVIPRIS